MKTFDLVVIGAGPGGYAAAIRAARLGMKVAVCEKDKPGGTCVNWGCIPSKAILRSAELYNDMKNAAAYGLSAGSVSADYGAVIRRSRQVAERSSRGVAYLFRKNGVEYVQGTARVTSPTTVAAGDEELSARFILVATGSAVRGLPGIVPDGRFVLTSDDALARETLPASVVVLGGGAVGVEFAYVYRSFGAEVTVLEMESQLLPRVDADVAKELEKAFRKQGIRVMTGAKATGVDPAARTVSVSAGGKAETLSADAVLVAVGRKMLTEGLGLEACGVRIGRGIVEVDEGMRTACPSIYAIGDIVGGMMLAHEASAMGVAAAERMAGQEARRPEPARVPACVFCQPEVAVVGLTEEEARAKGHDVKVSRFPFTALGKASASGHTEGFVKIVADGAYGEILGCHIIGHGAPDMIAEIGLAMSLEATWGEVGKAVHAHPTLPEAVKEAALMIGGEETDI